MKPVSIKYEIIMVLFLIFLCGGITEGELWLRLTFNEHEPSDANSVLSQNESPNSKMEAKVGQIYDHRKYTYDIVPNDGGSTTNYYGWAYGIDFVPSNGGMAAKFTGSNFMAHVNVLSDDSERIPEELMDNGMSIAYWVKFDVTDEAYMMLLSTGTNSGSDIIQHSLMHSSIEKPYRQRHFTNCTNGTVTVEAEQWYHLVWTINGGESEHTQKFYVNGQLMQSSATGKMEVNQEIMTRVGSVLTNDRLKERFSGQIDQLDIFDHQLTDTEIVVLCLNGPVGTRKQPDILLQILYKIIELKKNGDWSAFERYLDAMLTDKSDDSIRKITFIANNLAKNDVLLKNFLKYVQDSSVLAELYSEIESFATGLWLRLTFNEHVGGEEYDIVPNDGGISADYYGRAYGIDFVTSTERMAGKFSAPKFPAHIDITSDASSKLPPDLIDNGMSIAYWVKFDVTSEAYMMLLSTDVNDGKGIIQHSLMYPSEADLYKERHFVNSAIGKSIVDAEQWHYLAWTVDGAGDNQTERFYFDGQLMESREGIKMSIGQNFDTRFGAVWSKNSGAWCQQFSGEIDQLDIYNRQLNDAEIVALYQGGPVQKRKQSDVFLSILYKINEYKKNDNWSAFGQYLDTILSKIDNQSVRLAQFIASHLMDNDIRIVSFLEYLQDNSGTTDLYLKIEEELAEQYIEKKQYLKASEIYQDMAVRSESDKAYYKIKSYKCLIDVGQYRNAISGLVEFIDCFKATHRHLVQQAMQMKGQAYIQSGQFNDAVDAFMMLIIEHPDARQIAEINYFVGYCYMLKGKFKEATEFFNVLTSQYPGNKYTSRAYTCLLRIKSMTE